MKRTFKKLTILSLSALLAFSISGCSKKDAKEEQEQFAAFIQEEFVESMESNYLNTHVFLENPEDFGVDTSKITVEIDALPTEENKAEQLASMEASEKKFQSFDRDLLTDEQKDTYDIYSFMLETSKQLSDDKFQYMDRYFDSISGIHTQIPTLFADLTLRNEQDVKDLITLVANVKPYMNALLEYTKTQQEQGTLMLDIDSVITYCEKVVKEEENSSVLTSMNEHIENLALGSEKTSFYQQQLKEVFQSSFLPAYANIISVMKELDPAKNHTSGLAGLEHGKEYYALLFRNAIGSDTSIDDVKKDLNALAKKALLEAQKIALLNGDLYEDYYNDVYQTTYTDFESMLKDLAVDIEQDFPSVGEISYVIQPIDEDLASGGIAAYFNLPALDATTPKQIRVNTLDQALNVSSLQTFSTVAHEGLPGHMYQTAYAYKNLSDPWRKIYAGSSGYTEGYATYVELYALQYLKDIPQEVIQLEQSLTVYQNCIIALSDIGIHYDGWDVKQLEKFFKEKGLTGNDLSSLYTTLQANPTAYLPYYVGYLQFADLKEKAQDALKDKFDDYAFHEAILKSGSAPFSIVEKSVDAYIESAK